MAEEPTLQLSDETLRRLQEALPAVAERTVAAVIDDVPSYRDALTGAMGETIRLAVETALGGFVQLAARSQGAGPQAPSAAAVDGAYHLGRGEARSGRSVDALLSAYRIGARVSWREMSTIAVGSGAGAETLGRFAELVFAYIDALSAASVAGHTDESDTSGRVRQRLLERLAARLLDGSPDDVVTEAVERAGWTVPETLTAVLVPESQVRSVVATLPGETVQTSEDLDGTVLLLAPDLHGRRRAGLLRSVEGRGAVVGPARPWREVRASYARALRVRDLGRGPDTEDHLAALVLTADPTALADLRARVLSPLDDLRPATVEKLVETLRSWLLHHGRREAVAEELFVHPQTVRYRMGQLREVFGDRLEDPASVLELTIALGLPPEGPGREEPQAE